MQEVESEKWGRVFLGFLEAVICISQGHLDAGSASAQRQGRGYNVAGAEFDAGIKRIQCI